MLAAIPPGRAGPSDGRALADLVTRLQAESPTQVALALRYFLGIVQ